MAHHRSTYAAAIALAVAALAVPAAEARPDGPSPELRVTSSLAGTTSSTDLRTPDAKDAAEGPAPELQDQRSPDARDAASRAVVIGRGATAPAPTGPARSSAADAADNGSDTDWGDVAIVGGATAALLLAASGTTLVVRRRDASRKLAV